MAVSALVPVGAQAEETAAGGDDTTYVALDQDAMAVVDVDSVETSGEGANGAAELVLDGDPATYWHTKWAGGVDPLPHHLTIRLADEPVDLAKVVLTPRQSSNGSGRVHEYELYTSTDPECAEDSFTLAAEGAFGGEVAEALEDRSIALDAPTSAMCAKLVYLSAWGGKGAGPVSPEENVGSLAEFTAYTPGEVDNPATEVVVPEGAVTIADGPLQVRLHPDFPQVVDYRLGGEQLAGRIGEALTTILVNEEEQAVEVAAPVVGEDGTGASYALTFPELPGVSMTARFAVEDDVLTFRLTDIVDPDAVVRRVRIPHHDLVTVTTDRPEAQLTAADIDVDRSRNADSFEKLSETAASGVKGSWMVMAADGRLAAAFANNATEDNTAGGETADRVQRGNTRWQRQVRGTGEVRVGSVWSGTWTVRGSTSDLGIGPDEDPFVKVRITGDANADGAVDWQDAGVAMREIRTPMNGADEVADTVITRIPFNIVSQATHPFLRTLDDTKRIALATEGLGQQVLLKGYQAEGHDSAHPDYAGHYNERAGGFEDLVTLAEEGAEWNASFGVHVNATESYSEAYSFSEDLLRMPPRLAWNWMNQSYAIDGPKDLGTGNVLERFQEFRDEAPANLDWLYVDVYYPFGWEAQRFGHELSKQGWEVGSEWSYTLPDVNIWSHWANDENYGGQSNKGLNSQVVRFVENHRRDTFNPHPILSNPNVVEFEGWTGHVDYDDFIANVWQRNLPTKFLQQSPIMTWADHEITFENGTVATSPLDSIDGRTIPTDREMTFDGATVYTQGQYLLPWEDAQGERLYHYNPDGGATTWTLTDAYSGQETLTLYPLTDTGRGDAVTVPVVDGQVTIEAEAGMPYVLFPSTDVPEVRTPQWGQASGIDDPGYFSGTLAEWGTDGDVTVERTDRGNYQAVLGGPDEAVLFQKLGNPGAKGGPALPRGTYSAWAWVEIEPGQEREVTLQVRGQGVKALGSTSGKKNLAATTVSSSTALNATASDEKLGTYFQRVRVTFSTTGGQVDLRITAAPGDADVRVDDWRIVPFGEPEDPSATAETILYEDFEAVDTGYWPFVTGSANRGGDARTQLAERHEPYSQSGWWGPDSTGKVVEGGKLIDNVIDGTWSLLAHEENTGLVLRTTSASVPLQEGHRYRVSFDYQAGRDTYFFVTGEDQLTGDAVEEQETGRVAIPAAHETERFTHEFATAPCGAPAWFGIVKAGGGYQADLAIDGLRVEDLGPDDANPACADAEITVDGGLAAGEATTVTTTVTSREEAEVTDVTHVLSVPEGWTAELVEAGASTLAPGETSESTWSVTPAADATEGELELEATYQRDGDTATVTASRSVTVLQPGDQWVSDLVRAGWLVGTPSNGWGPVELDMSNGESGEGDGAPLTVQGRVYDKGLGVHAPSEVVLDLQGRCTTFTSDVGIDDEMSRGTVTFEVRGDGEVLAGPTEVIGHDDAAVTLTADVTGVQQLSLVVTDGGDGNGGDHADWAGAKVTCD